jgi:hypothetical protein
MMQCFYEPTIAKRRLLLFLVIMAVVYGFIGHATLFAQNPAKTCTVASIRGVPVAGMACGGTSHGLGCTAGAIYKCKSGPVGTQNNCTLVQACAVGCVANGSPNPLADSCFTGPSPITVSPLSVLGGDDLAVTLQLADSHPDGAYVNLSIDRGDVVPGAYCAHPFELAPGQTSASFGLSTGVVTSPTPVRIFTDLAYTDASGTARELASVPQVVTLNPGGAEPPIPALASLELTPSAIGAGGVSSAYVTLSRMAPASGVTVNLSSSNPSVVSILPTNQPTILGSCIDGSGPYNILAANSVAQPATVTISASSGAAGQAPLTQPLSVTAGCVPVACSGGPTCGPQPNGCGGTMTCGCTNLPGQTCGGGGVAGQCGPPVVAVSALTLSPNPVVSGNSSTGTVTLNMPAPSGGALVSLSSTTSFATVPQLMTIAAGQTRGTFLVNTTAFTAGTVSAEISAGKGDTVTAFLTLNAASVTCVPTTCAALNKNCGAIPDGCGGTLTCGACSGSQTCGGGGAANVCGGSATSATLTLSVSGRNGTVTSTPAGLSVSSGNSESANFDIGTTITLRSNDKHGAVWSGMCSSAGKASQSCSFTLNTTGAVTTAMQ